MLLYVYYHLYQSNINKIAYIGKYIYIKLMKNSNLIKKIIKFIKFDKI